MTAQISDRFIHNNDTFGIVSIDGEGLFEPKDYGINVIPISTACWRGYYCCYGITDNSLCLHEVYLGLNQENERLIQKGNGIQLFGKTPHRCKYVDGKIIKIDISKNFREAQKIDCSWDWRCDNLNQLIDFTGGMLIGSDDLGRVSLFPQSCSKIYELVFDAGQLIEAIDHGSIMSEFQNMSSNKESNHGNHNRTQELEQWLQQHFSWDYKL